MPRWLSLANQQHYWIAGLALLLMLGVGYLLPRRQAGAGRWKAWAVNITMAVIGFALLELAVPWILKGAGMATNALHAPALARMGLPVPLLVLLSLLLLDLLSYAVHLASHQLPWLWRLHKVHHSDIEFDATTAVLHHPLESLVSAAIQLFVLALLGLPLVEIVLYGLLVNLHNPFVHSNIRLPERLDRVLRWVMVTPDMHRVHHSARMDEGNSNFGMLFPWWDRLLGSYLPDLADGQGTARLGLPGDGEPVRAGFVQTLVMPLGRNHQIAPQQPQP